jgi:hypothetical protein
LASNFLTSKLSNFKTTILNRLKRQLLKKKLYTKSRLVVVNEETFEEIFSLRLTIMNVFVVGTIGAILIVTLTTFFIAFTPLREYIPGYASGDLKRNATQLALKSDSLTTALAKNEAYITSIKKVLMGQVEYAKLSKDSITKTDNPTEIQVDLDATDQEKDFIKNHPVSK